MSKELMLGIYLLGSVAVALGSVYICVTRSKRSRKAEIMVAAALPVTIYGAMYLLAVAVASGSRSGWDSARLTPSVAFSHGQQVYATEESGAVQTTMYPPVWILSYLPAAIGRTPAQVVRIGVGISLTFAFLPVLLLFMTRVPDVGIGLLGTAAFVLAAVLFESLAYSLFRPHADAPSLGFGLLACWLATSCSRPSAWRFATVATLTWLAVLSKQVMLPLLLVLPIWYLARYGVKVAVAALTWLAVTGGVVVGLLFMSFETRGVWLNIVMIPLRVPWVESSYPPALRALRVTAELWHHSVPLIIALLTAVIASVALRPGLFENRNTLRHFLRDNPWLLTVLLSMWLVPVSVLGRVKVGGDINTFSPAVYFLMVSVFWVGLRAPDGYRLQRWDRSREGSLAVIALCSLVLAGAAVREISETIRRGTSLVDHPSEVAYRYLLHEDSTVYFPNHPLSHLLATGSYYHLGKALYDREVLAGVKVSKEQRASFLPADPSLVCWEESWGLSFQRAEYFPHYNVPVDVARLGTNWDCFGVWK